ncbi:MAG: cytochrome c [Terracidiphilus sp.]|jgi:mono/diheme cytochrome c family protein
MLKPFLLSSAVILLVLVSTSAAGRAQESAPASTNPVKPTAASQEKAKGLFARDCALCHGDNGNGKTDVAASMSVTLDDWTQAKALAAKSDQELFNTIRKGKGDKMPPEDVGRAKNDEVWNLIIYIRNLPKGQPAAAPPQPEAAPPPPDAAPTQPEAAPAQPAGAPPPAAAAPAQPTN